MGVAAEAAIPEPSTALLLAAALVALPIGRRKRLVFGTDAGLRRREDDEDDLAQPGYVGPDYGDAPVKVLFIGENPGNPSGASERDADQIQYKKLRAIRDAEPAHVEAAFNDLMDALGRAPDGVMRHWRIYSLIIKDVVEKAGIDLLEVAHLNLVKWRGDPSPAVLERGWRKHTQGQVKVLDPDIIVALGKTFAGQFEKLYRGEARVVAVPRVRGDKGRHPDAKGAIDKAAWLIKKMAGETR